MDNIKTVSECTAVLQNSASSVKEKYEVLFHLRTRNDNASVQALIDNYGTMNGSELLQHEIMYILGQMSNDIAVDFLITILNDEKQAPVVRHEAGEALSNYPDHTDRILPELQKYVDSDISVVRSTVRIAIRKLQTYSKDSNYKKYLEANIEPADPFTAEQLKAHLKTEQITHEDILKELLNSEVEEFIKYRIIYYLRNQGDENSVKCLARLLDAANTPLTSPLMRHELCFIIGQLQNKADYSFVKDALMGLIKDVNEEAIVRHEAVLTYNDIWGNEDFVEIVKNDKDKLVSESVEIILE